MIKIKNTSINPDSDLFSIFIKSKEEHLEYFENKLNKKIISSDMFSVIKEMIEHHESDNYFLSEIDLFKKSKESKFNSVLLKFEYRKHTNKCFILEE